MRIRETSVAFAGLLLALPVHVFAQNGDPLAGSVARAIASGVFKVADADSCIAGHNPFAVGTTNRIRGMSEISLKNYLSLSSKTEHADVRSAFSTKNVKLTWSIDGKPGDINAVNDPIARTFQPSSTPVDSRLRNVQFLIGGDKYSTMGLWSVVSAEDQGKVIGWYRARFWRHNTLGGQTWDLMNLEVFSGPLEPGKVVQYCREPGDVEKHLAEMKEKEAEKLRKKAARATKP